MISAMAPRCAGGQLERAAGRGSGRPASPSIVVTDAARRPLEACLRSTSASWMRSSSSNTSRLRATRCSSIDSGRWMPVKAAVRSMRSNSVEHALGHRVDEVAGAVERLGDPAREVPRVEARACRTAGRSATIWRRSSSPSRSTSGFVIWRRPRNAVTLPKNSASEPSGSCRVRHGWLKNVMLQVARAVGDAGARCAPCPGRGPGPTSTTRPARTPTPARPARRSRMADCFVLSMQRRG